MRFPLLLCPFFAVAVALPSQATHLVGPGGLAQIRDALAIAQPGDRIHVQPGTYAHFTATVGVTIRALTPGSVEVGYDISYAPPGCTLLCSATEGPTTMAPPAGQTVHVVGLRFLPNAQSTSFFTAFHRVRATSGRTHFENCTIESFRDHGLLVESGAQVHLDDCTVAGVGQNFGAYGAYVLAGASLTAVGSRIQGAASFTNQVGAGLLVSGGTAHLSDCVLTGGVLPFPFPVVYPALQGAGTAWLHGCLLQGGGCAVSWGGPQPQFDDCTFTSPTNCGIPTGPFPSLLGVAQSAPPLLGAPFTLDWQTEPNGLVAVFASFGLGRLDLPGILAQPAWLDPANEFFVGALFADPSGAATTTFQLPANPLLTDLELWFKGVSGFAFPLQSSVPVGGVLR